MVARVAFPLKDVDPHHRSEEKASIIIKAWLNAAVFAAAKEGEGMTFDIKVRLVFNSC